MVLTRDDVVAWYEMQREEESGTTYDEHAQLDGTVNGATLSNDTPSDKFIGSFDFDGTNDEIDVPVSTFNETITVSAWINKDSDKFQEVLAYASSSANDKYVRFGINSSGKILYRYTNGALDREYVGDTTLSNSTWYHLCWVVNGSYTDVKMYVNGSEETLTTNLSGSPSTHTTLNQGSIGSLPRSSPADYFDGHISGVQIFNRALTSTEVSTLYNSGDGVTYREQFSLSDDLEAYYKLDGDATDSTANGNDGTVTGATSGSQGVIGTCYSFDGTNDNIELPFLVDQEPYSISLWFKNDTTSDDHPDAIISQYDSDELFAQDFRLSVRRFETANTNHLDPQLENDTDWHHMVIIFNGSSSQVWKDGSQIGSDFTNQADLTSGSSRVLQLMSKNDTDYKSGTLDEVGFYTRALTAGEIRRKYSFGAGLRYEDLDNISPLVDGVVAAYNFDGDVLDAKNNTWDATDNGTSAGTAHLGSGARDFEESESDYVTTISEDLGHDYITVAGWINPETWPTVAQVFDGESGTGSNRSFLMRSNSGSFEWGIARSLSYDIATWSSNLPSTGSYSQVGGSYDGATVSLWVNNSEVATQSASGTLQVYWPKALGRRNTGADRYYDGLMDEPTFWARALSSTEWNAFYNGGSGKQFPFEDAVVGEEAAKNALLIKKAGL